MSSSFLHEVSVTLFYWKAVKYFREINVQILKCTTFCFNKLTVPECLGFICPVIYVSRCLYSLRDYYSDQCIFFLLVNYCTIFSLYYWLKFNCNILLINNFSPFLCLFWLLVLVFFICEFYVSFLPGSINPNPNPKIYVTDRLDGQRTDNRNKNEKQLIIFGQN